MKCEIRATKKSSYFIVQTNGEIRYCKSLNVIGYNKDNDFVYILVKKDGDQKYCFEKVDILFSFRNSILVFNNLLKKYDFVFPLKKDELSFEIFL